MHFNYPVLPVSGLAGLLWLDEVSTLAAMVDMGIIQPRENTPCTDWTHWRNHSFAQNNGSDTQFLLISFNLCNISKYVTSFLRIKICVSTHHSVIFCMCVQPNVTYILLNMYVYSFCEIFVITIQHKRETMNNISCNQTMRSNHLKHCIWMISCYYLQK